MCDLVGFDSFASCLDVVMMLLMLFGLCWNCRQLMLVMSDERGERAGSM